MGNNIYKGADYKFEYGGNDPFSNSNDILSPSSYRTNVSQLGLTTHPNNANQLKEVSDKLSTGAKTIEVTAIMPNILDSIPKQQFDEIRRLKKLVGADITFHGPLIEPTGISKGGWDESSRKQAERQIFDAVARSHALNPEGNTVVTLHTSNGLPSPTLRMKEFNKTTGQTEEVVKNIFVIDENSGEMGALPQRFLIPDKLHGEKVSPQDGLNKLNVDMWDNKVRGVRNNLTRADQHIEAGLEKMKEINFENKEEDLKNIFKVYKNDKEKFNKYINDLSESNPLTADKLKRQVHEISTGDTYLQETYRQLQDVYGQAYDAAEKMGEKGKKYIEKLDEYKNKSAPNLLKWRDDPTKLEQFSEVIGEGLEICGEIKPRLYRPVEEFGIEKSAQTFGNVALNAYQEYGENAPIISLENPPMDQGGLARGDEIAKLVEATRNHFVNKAVENGIMNKEKAEQQAEKLIGVTWDVGHINIMRKYGYDSKDIVKETEKVKDYVKHVHLSDNFGQTHTELPMGMGNVPLKEHLAMLGEKAEKAKHIIETGGPWYENFRTSPLPEVMHAMGSPIYPMHMQPYWNSNSGMSGVPGYFSGTGYNPEVHHSIYGSGFSTLPTELGGSVAGRGGRLSGAPME